MDDDDIRACMEIVAALKVMLLADDDCNGGLNETSRKRAWRMARDLGFILLKAKVDQ